MSVASLVLRAPRTSFDSQPEWTLELLHAASSGQGRPPLLFLHGAFAAAWVWAEHMLPFFAARGFSAYALSFRGHGASGERRLLSSAGLADYLADARAGIAALGDRPVLIGHSLGGLVAQLALGVERLSGLVLLASLPPDGALAASLRLAVTDPLLWAQISGVAIGGKRFAAAAPARLRAALFSDETPPAVADRHLARMQRESTRAIAEAQVTWAWTSAAALGVPALVLGAGRDRLVPRDAVSRTAWFHGAEHGMIEHAHHAFMLERHWIDAAERMLAWLERL